MRLVAKYSSDTDAKLASQRLESKGIATFISSKRSYRLGALFTGAFHVGLWVVLDRQFEDARRLLEDPNHKVSMPLTSTEMIEIRSSVRSGDMSQILRFLFQLLIWAAIFAILVAFVVRL